MFFFDILHRDGVDLLDAPTTDRLAALDALVPPAQRVDRLLTSDPVEAGAFLDATLAAGHEGVMAKAPDAQYQAGRRGAGWLKVKPVHTLDLVVLAVEWGSGAAAASFPTSIWAPATRTAANSSWWERLSRA